MCSAYIIVRLLGVGVYFIVRKYSYMVSKPRRGPRVLLFVRLVYLTYATVVHVVYVFRLNS